MRYIASILTVLAFSLGTPALAVEFCTDEQLKSHEILTIDYDDADNKVSDHRQFELPIISYPYGHKQKDWIYGLDGQKKKIWNYDLTFLVDPQGRVSCVKLPEDSRWYKRVTKSAPFWSQIDNWQYRPFTKDAQPNWYYVNETIREQELPNPKAKTPVATNLPYEIRLFRSNCLGYCPAYEVRIDSDGNASYEGYMYSHIMGKYSFNVPKEDVANIYAFAKASGFWGMRKEYRGFQPDAPNYIVCIKVSGSEKCVRDYLGQLVGAPNALFQLEDEIDRIGKASAFIELKTENIEFLKSAGVDFKGHSGANILGEVLSNSKKSDLQIINALIDEGADIRGGFLSRLNLETFTVEEDKSQSVNLLAIAINKDDHALAYYLIDKGILFVNDKPDMTIINGAFVAAVAKNDFEMVKLLFAYGPELYQAHDDVEEETPKQIPVTLLLEDCYTECPSVLPMVSFLLEKGIDPKASDEKGKTLLHIAAKRKDKDLINYLLDHGADIEAVDQYGDTPLLATSDADIMILLLERGANPHIVPNYSESFLSKAFDGQYDHPKVAAWLTAHGIMAPSKSK